MLGKPLTQVQPARGGRDAYVPRRSLLSKTGTRGSLPESVRPPTLALNRAPVAKTASLVRFWKCLKTTKLRLRLRSQFHVSLLLSRKSQRKVPWLWRCTQSLRPLSTTRGTTVRLLSEFRLKSLPGKNKDIKLLVPRRVTPTQEESPSLTLLLAPGLLELKAWRLPKERVKAKANCLAIATRVVTRRLLNLRSLCPTSLKLLLLRSLPTESLPIRISGLSPVWLLLSGSSPPQVSTVGAIRKALEEGSELPGNLVLCDTTEGVSNLQALWAAYQCVAPVTVALVAKQESTVSSKGKKQESTVSNKGMQSESLVSVGRQGSLRNEVVRVVCSQLSEQAGPVPKRAITTKIPVSSVVTKVTVRLLAPQCFRQFVAGVETEDDPRDIISEWAKLLECPLADLTGGTWERISDKSGSVVVGHLRVSRSLAHKIVNLSGTRALFATRLDKAVERPQVAWVPKPKDESTEDYLRRVAAEAQTRRVSQVFRQGFRQGGMSNLGLSGVPASEFDKSAVKQWLLHMAPKSWTQIDISAFLLSQGWRQAQVITRRKSWTKGQSSRMDLPGSQTGRKPR